ncbi:MAG: hypothetical protein CMF63_07815 [Magnetovibrio sp.]|nr:hypothetical protein [Magnetovibrio sp.]
MIAWRWWGRRADPEALLADLRSAQLGRYSRALRYRDFREVFLGTPAGKRVLWQILDWARLYRSVAVKGDPHQTYFRDGERNIGLRIMATVNAEPSGRASEAVSAPEKGPGH